jgi:hypothetical protein
LTRRWVDKFLATAWPESYRARIRITTTSDWTTLNIVGGGVWLRPELISTSADSANAVMEADGRFALLQPLADAEKGMQVEMTWDLLLSGMDPAGNLVLNIDRGNIGQTSVTIFNYLGDTPTAIRTFQWAGITTGRNSRQVTISVSDLITTTP